MISFIDNAFADHRKFVADGNSYDKLWCVKYIKNIEVNDGCVVTKAETQTLRYLLSLQLSITLSFEAS